MKWGSWRRWTAIIILILTGLAIWKHQDIIDWWRLRDYQPPARITQLAQATTMNDYGQKLFYVHHPKLDDKNEFSGHCRIAEESIVLGCYQSHEAIYIFDVQDARLKGIHEVTAAHEMLHAAYDRLGSDEQSKIDKQLTDFYATITDERIKDTVEAYRKRDSSVVPNELHSIVGTEVRDIPAELETYYKRYFTNRLKIIEFSEKYEKTFTDLKDQVADYDGQIAKLKTQIQSNEAQLNFKSEELTRERKRLDDMLAAGDHAGYNAAVPGFNQKVREYNSLVTATKALIDKHNRLVEQRNQLAVLQQELIEAIDSRHAKQQQE